MNNIIDLLVFSKWPKAGHHISMAETFTTYIIPLLLSTFAIIASGREALFRNIDCFFPSQFPPNWMSYGLSFCSQHNYISPLNQEITANHRNSNNNIFPWVIAYLVFFCIWNSMPNFIYVLSRTGKPHFTSHLLTTVMLRCPLDYSPPS